ncbi:unnamed protein product [Auanema sp. JU1783]|nr:unnamed protein product [Auanema sp. JU1783]
MDYESEDICTIEKYDCESSIHSDFEYIQSDSLISDVKDDENKQTILPARCSSFASSILKRSLHDELSSSECTVTDKAESINIQQIHQLNVLKESLEETAEQVMILLTDRMKQKELVNELRNKVQRLEVKNERLKTNVERKRRSTVKEFKNSLTSSETREDILEVTTSENEGCLQETWKKFLYIFVILLIAVIIAMQLQVRKLDSHNILLRAEVNKLTHKLTRYETMDMTYQKGENTVEIKKCQSLSEQNEKVSVENINLRQENTVLATIIIIFVLVLLFKLFFSSILDALQMIEKKV